MKIGFFLSDYPVFSETFVLNELLELQKSGINGKIWYEVPGNQSNIQPQVKKIKFPIQRIPKKILRKRYVFKIINAHFYWIIKYPDRYIDFLSQIFKMKWFDLRIIIKSPLVAKQVKSFETDLLYVHEADNAFLFASCCSSLCKIPVGIIFHTYFLFNQNKYLVQKIFRANFSIFQSEYSRNYAKNNFKVNKNCYCKMHVVSSPGIDTNFFKKKKFKILPKIKKDNITKIITIGRLEKSKGFDILIKAILLLKKSNIKIKCQIIGSGSEKQNITNLIKKLNLKNEISLTGAIPHNKKLIKHMSKANLFILPSIINKNNDRDMQPNVIKEAMSMNLLCLTSNLGGINEVIKDSKNGFLINKPNSKKLANKIENILIIQKNEKMKVGKKARKTILRKFQLKIINYDLIDIFKKYA